MDPMAIIGAASSLIVSFARVSKSLSDIKSSFDKAPIAIASMMTECKTISAVLTRLQNLTLGNPVALSPRLMTPETLIESFDDALTGCMLVLSALEAQLQRLIEGEKPETTGFVTRVRLLWNEEAMSQLLGHLRGQHTAISTLIALFQAESLHDGSEPAMMPKKELSIFNFSMQSFSVTDATSNINVQLQRSIAYRNAGAASVEELWRRNEELKDDNEVLRDRLDNLEQEAEQKGGKIASLLAKVSSLKTQVSSLETQKLDLEQQLQATTTKIDRFSAYQKLFRQTGAKFVQQIEHDRNEMKELEARLSSLRESYGRSMISHLIEHHEIWNESRSKTPTPSPQLSLEGSSSCSPSARGEDLPRAPDAGSPESTDWKANSDSTVMLE